MCKYDVFFKLWMVLFYLFLFMNIYILSTKKSYYNLSLFYIKIIKYTILIKEDIEFFLLNMK